MTEVEDNRPGWMIELENRKRKPRLAHEAGAGSPCLSCKEACPGLDLHFWRKICKNCKCGRDEHDVIDDEFPQFDLLLGPSGRLRKKAIFLPVAMKKQSEHENAFEWVPPDVTTEIAIDYMKALPENKLPIQGSAGAALRKQQLQKQLPLHDMDHKACDKLSEDEKKQFEKYLENLKKYVGQGRVSKVMGARPFNKSLMTPANAADMQPMSPQRKPQAYIPTGEATNLRTPSSFIPKNPGASAVQGSQHQQTWLAANLEGIQAQIPENASSTGVRLGQYHPTLENVSATGQVINSESVNSSRHPAQQFAHTARLTDTQQNNASFLQNPGNAPYIPDFGQVNYTEEYSKMGEQSELHATSEIAAPLVDPTINGNVIRSNSPHMPNQHIAKYQNIQTTQNISCASPISSGHYHKASLPLSHASETNVLNENPKVLDHDYFGQEGQFGEKANQLRMGGTEAIGRGALSANQLGDISRLSQNISYPNEISSANAQLAEQMLSDALLPPSAVHTDEIIGSTLDRNKLKYIQEQLSAKYSKDDLPSQHMLKSQRIETVNPQFGQGIVNIQKNAQAQDSLVDKDGNRIAIIAAMKNPSGLLEDNKRLENIEAEYANSLDPSHYVERTGSIVPWNEGCPQSERLCMADPLSNGELKGPNCEWNLGNPSSTSNPVQLPRAEQLRAELSHQPVNSHVIYSQSVGNPSFPEGTAECPGLRQNPASVDQLRGALEELSVEPIQLHKCIQCKEDIHPGNVVVTAERAKDALWHPGCFVCSTCNELLVDLVYFYHKGKLYCGRDLAALLNIPRCFACDELIFVREYTVAEGHNYHVKHFCCWDCDIPLAGQQYISESDRPLCLPCYQKTYAKTCETCKKVIAADQQGVAVKNLDFHATDACFCCFTCKRSLLSGKMAIKEDRPFCSKECITEFMNNKP